MPLHRTVFVPVLALAILISTTPWTGAAAQEPDAIPDAVKKQIEQNPDKFLETVVQRLFQISPDGIATAEKLARFRRMEIAKQRASMMLQILPMDLDGDGSVSPDELDEAMAAKPTSQSTRYEGALTEADTNKDGTISFEELIAYADHKASAKQEAIQAADRYNPLIFDQDGDGQVDAAEIVRRVRVFAAGPPLSTAPARTSNAFADLNDPRECGVPMPAAHDEVILLSVSHGSGVSTVAVNGANMPTSVATITIEKGDKPLYIFAAARSSVIWKVDGRIDRIANFVVQPNRNPGEPHAGAGVIGLDRKIVSFVDPPGCIKPFTSAGDGAAIIAKATLEAQLRRPIDHVTATRQAYRLGIPSGVAPSAKGQLKGTRIIEGNRRYELTDGRKVELKDDLGPPDRPSGVDARTWSDLYRAAPDGIIRIDPKAIVAPAAVEPYAILPGDAGLVQLMETGTVRRTKDYALEIVRPFERFPPFLSTEDRFILTKGIPMPKDRDKDTPVIIEETGECVGERGCPR